jgi:archaetidylinositol phosphate synthase
VLNKLRGQIDPVIDKLALRLASKGVSAYNCTFFGFFLSIAAGIAYAMAMPSLGFSVPSASIVAGVLILVAGLCDILDGAIARATNQTSRTGAFIDSLLDRISEVVIFVGISIGNLSSPVLCVVSLGLSLVVSYSRARAEALGIQLKGIGIGERAERMIILAVIGMLPIIGAVQWGVIIVSIVAAVTIVHRALIVTRKIL